MRGWARALGMVAVAALVVTGVTSAASARPGPSGSDHQEDEFDVPGEHGTPAVPPETAASGNLGQPSSDATVSARTTESPAIVATGEPKSGGTSTGGVVGASTLSSSSSSSSEGGQPAAAPGQPGAASDRVSSGGVLLPAPHGPGALAQVLLPMSRRSAGVDPPAAGGCLVAVGMGSATPDVCGLTAKVTTRLEPIVRGTKAPSSDPPSGGGGGALPLSGADTVRVVVFGAALLGVGALVLWVRRRVTPLVHVSIADAHDEGHAIDAVTTGTAGASRTRC